MFMNKFECGRVFNTPQCAYNVILNFFIESISNVVKSLCVLLSCHTSRSASDSEDLNYMWKKLDRVLNVTLVWFWFGSFDVSLFDV